jgi:F-type H+-transporting ATPase subunit a
LDPLIYNLALELERQVLSPLSQFEIRDLLSIEAPILGNIYISVTNIGFYLIIGASFILVISLLSTNYNKIVNNNWSISLEALYATIHSIVINQINSKKGQIYFPFIYALFVFILINNLIGMVPYSFASTSHFVLTFAISFTIVLGSTILGFQKHGLEFFSLLVPAGCPLALLPLLVLIEFISYLARNISLGLRLAANILSGHMLLHILAGFTYNIMNSSLLYFFVGLIPLGFIIAFSGLELGIAFIQAQVFVVLTSGRAVLPSQGGGVATSPAPRVGLLGNAALSGW